MKQSRTDRAIARHLNTALGLAIEQAALATLRAERKRIITSLETIEDRLGTLPKEDVVNIVENILERDEDTLDEETGIRPGEAG